jgi:hypothetical protein
MPFHNFNLEVDRGLATVPRFAPTNVPAHGPGLLLPGVARARVVRIDGNTSVTYLSSKKATASKEVDKWVTVIKAAEVKAE